MIRSTVDDLNHKINPLALHVLRNQNVFIQYLLLLRYYLMYRLVVSTLVQHVVHDLDDENVTFKR
jgi:hypothetical protein